MLTSQPRCDADTSSDLNLIIKGTRYNRFSMDKTSKKRWLLNDAWRKELYEELLVILTDNFIKFT